MSIAAGGAGLPRGTAGPLALIFNGFGVGFFAFALSLLLAARGFAEAVRLAPDNRLAVMHLGLLALRMGLPERALPCFESLMAMGETSEELVCLRGQALFQLD